MGSQSRFEPDEHGDDEEPQLDPHGEAQEVEVRPWLNTAPQCGTRRRIPTLAPVDPGPASPFTDEGELPEGEAKAAAVRSMFDAIARYDLVNRIMTFRMDVGWRRRTVASLDLPAAHWCSTSPAAPATSAASSPPRGSSRSASTSFGMLAAARTDAPLVHADALRLPVPDGAVDGATCGFALRNFVDLGAFFVELGRVVRPGGRIALLEVAEPPNRSCGGATASTSAPSCPGSAAALSDGAPTATCPSRSPTCRHRSRCSRHASTAGFERPRRDLLTTGIAQLLTGTRG